MPWFLPIYNIYTKLNNTIFNSFLQKYTDKHTPAESTVQKNDVDVVWKDVLDEIKKTVGNVNLCRVR
jgi:hypothetical protein